MQTWMVRRVAMIRFRHVKSTSLLYSNAGGSEICPYHPATVLMKSPDVEKRFRYPAELSH